MCPPAATLSESTSRVSVGESTVRKQMEKDGKSLKAVSTKDFVKMVGISVPVWFVTMLPMTLFYKAGKAIVDKVTPPAEFTPESPIDSGYIVKDDELIPREKRTYDIVVLGATGFAGKLAARHLAKTYGVNQKVRWAIAGRSQSKLDQIKTWLSKDCGIQDAESIDCMVVDTAIPATLPNLVRDTRVVVTTVGPFWKYGSTVVEFCAKFGTHYADITAEGSWVKTMMAQWQETAKKTGAKIISYAGHDSIPWDLSVSLLVDELKSESGEDLINVECYDEVNGGISGGTLATLMMMSGDNAPQARFSSDPFLQTLEGSVHREEQCSSEIGASLSKIMTPWDKKETVGSPFLMAPVNFDVIAWSQTLRGGKPIKYNEVLVNPDFKTAFVGLFNLVLLFTGVMNPITKFLFSNYVLPKPGEGPTLDDMENNSFLTVTMEATGSKGTKLESSMYFPRDAGYLDTARMLVESGLAMALEEEKLPVQGGGFLTPGVGLGKPLLKRLTNTGTYHDMRKV